MNAKNIARTTNKIKVFAAATFVLALFALGLAGCSSPADGGDAGLALVGTESAPEAAGASSGGAADNGAYITLGLADAESVADGVSASALPDVAEVVFGKFVLSGTSAQQGIAPVTWSCGDGTTDARPQLAGAKVPVTKGASYTFTLTATTTGGAVYEGATDPALTTIDANVKQLRFDLRLSSVTGGLGGANGAKGSASVGVNLPSGGTGGDVNKVTVTLCPVDDGGNVAATPVTGFEEKDVPIQDGKALFETGDLDAGVYCASFSLWGGNDSTSLLGTWREFIGIAGGQSSHSELNKSGGADGDQVDLAYSITYHKNDDDRDPAQVAAPTSYSRNTDVTLDALKAASSRPNYRIHSWYTDEQCNNEFLTTGVFAADLNLYAVWDECHAIDIPSFVNGYVQATPAGDAIAGDSITIEPFGNPGWTPGDITIKALNPDGSEMDPQPAGFPVVIPRGTSPKVFTMPDLPYGGRIGVDAEFLELFAVDIGSLSNGSVTAAPQYGTAKDAKPAAAAGDTVTLNIAPENNWLLNVLTVDGQNQTASVTNNKYTFNMPAKDIEVGATFKKKTFTLTFSGTNGSVAVKRTDTNVAVTSGTAVEWGTPMSVTATANQYYDFDKFTPSNVTLNGSGATRTFEMPASNATIAASFAKTKYSVTCNSASNGNVKVGNSSSASVTWGETVTLTISPNSNYLLNTITVKQGSSNVSLSGSGNSRTFTMPKGAVTVDATFKKKQFKLNFSATNGTITVKKGTTAVTSGQSHDWGTQFSVSISPASGYEGGTITASSGTLSGSGNSRTFTLATSDATLTASFSAAQPEPGQEGADDYTYDTSNFLNTKFYYVKDVQWDPSNPNGSVRSPKRPYSGDGITPEEWWTAGSYTTLTKNSATTTAGARFGNTDESKVIPTYTLTLYTKNGNSYTQHVLGTSVIILGLDKTKGFMADNDGWGTFFYTQKGWAESSSGTTNLSVNYTGCIYPTLEELSAWIKN